MHIEITSFTNPFSFFCKTYEDSDEIIIEKCNLDIPLVKAQTCDVNHGQYVAVFWNDKWVRGIVSMESQFSFWLIDYGIYIRPNEKTTYVDLPYQYKKPPTKVFEASIHGVIPMDKGISMLCEIENTPAKSWNKGSIEIATTLIRNARNVQFIPVAVLNMKHNDIILGDLYLKTDGKYVNLVDELEKWPVFLEKNRINYFNNLSDMYTSRKKHRANSCIPEIKGQKLPILKPCSSVAQYNAICDLVTELNLSSDEASSEDGETVKETIDSSEQILKLTPREMEKYSRMFINIGGYEHNVLQILLNKIKDLKMCERYKDIDEVSQGRGTTRSRRRQAGQP